MIFARFDCSEAEGVMLAHRLRLSARTIKKGKVLTAADLHDMQMDGLHSVTGVRLSDDDVDEDKAAVAVAKALMGPHLTLGSPMGGRCNLYAKKQGVAVIDRARIEAINLSGGDITVATLAEYSEAMAEQAVASVKVITFAVSRQCVDHCVSLAEGTQAAVELHAYRQKRVALILTEAPGLKASILDSTGEVTAQRLISMGSLLVSEQRCAHSLDALTQALQLALASDCDMVLICGASVTVDTSDIVPSAIVRLGGEIDHFGMPVEPGNMLLLARCGSQTIINLPGCSRSPKLNGLDWILQRELAGISVGPRDIQLMGVGGLIKDIPHIQRVKRQRLSAAVEHRVSALHNSNEGNHRSQVAAIVLAAGRSSRMGALNKLLVDIDGKPMLDHVVAAAQASDAEQVIVVTGYQAEQVQHILQGRDICFAHNAQHTSGMASSLRRGLEAVCQSMQGALILLGDMPFVTTQQINQLIAEFSPNMERDIVAPFKDGRRGNPVLWASRYFKAMKTLAGDTGARSLLKEHAANIWDVPMANEAIFADLDTPKELASIERKIAQPSVGQVL